MNQATELPDPHTTPLREIDLSDARLYLHNAWRPYFARLREQDPVHYTPESAFGPFWSITRFEDILAVDSNHEAFSSSPSVLLGGATDGFNEQGFIATDPPLHDEHRRAVQPVVAPRNLAEMESIIRGKVTDILDNLPVGETFDWVEHVSINLTTQMLAVLFGYPFEEREKLTYWSDLATGTPEMGGASVSTEERIAGLQECLASFQRLWQERKEQSGGMDLISLLQKSPETANIIADPQSFIGTILLLIVGGNDTTRNSATGGVVALNQYPGEYDKLRADPSLIPSMVSEIIRWQTPLAHMRRIATRDTEVNGKLIKKGDKVVMWYLSGNRDESAIENADEFIIDRANPRHHASFGFGVHRCMGNRLAEMQLRILWEEVMQRFSFVEVVGEPRRVQSNFVMGYEKLPVRLHAK